MVYDGGRKIIARMRPRGYTLVFLGWDFLSLLLQAIGGAIASLAILQSKVCALQMTLSRVLALIMILL